MDKSTPDAIAQLRRVLTKHDQPVRTGGAQEVNRGFFPNGPLSLVGAINRSVHILADVSEHMTDCSW
jgi:hypothetical protein